MNKILRNLCLFLLILACLAATVLMAMLGVAMYRHFFSIPDYRGGVVSSYLPISGKYLCLGASEKYVFDIKDNILLPICDLEECGGDCPFSKNSYSSENYKYTVITACEEDRIYFHCVKSLGMNKRSYSFAYFDTNTRKTVTLAELSEDSARYSNPYSKSFLYEDYLYCIFMKPRDGAITNYQSDYINALYRIPKNGGEFEFLFECDSEELHMVADGKAITIHNLYTRDLYCYDLETGEKTTIYTSDYVSPNITYFDGKIFLISQGNSEKITMDLISIDLESGEADTLAESVSCFSLAPGGKGIYYVTESQSNVRFCDIDGNNKTELYSGKHLFSAFTVIDGKMYGAFTMYDEKTAAYTGGDSLIVFDPATNTYESYTFRSFHNKAESFQ